jgi:hypothetical protein
MSATLAITRLTLRSILRERVALSMLALLSGIWLLLPSALEGDGTLGGELRMLIRYTLGFSTVLLAGMTVWISCAAVAGDLSSKRLHMVLSKPVSPARIWLGKWLAVCVLITSLMLSSGVATLLQVQRLVRSSNLTPSEIHHLQKTLLTSRTPITAPEPSYRDAAMAQLQQQLESGWLPPADWSEEQLIQRAVQYVRAQRFAVAGGQDQEWQFDLPQSVQEGEALQLSVEYDGGSLGLTTVTGEWTLRNLDGAGEVRIPVEGSPNGNVVFDLGTTDVLQGATRILARFHYQGPEDQVVFFKPGTGVQLFRPSGSFAFNLLRAVTVLAGLLAVLAAIGVGAGAVFSLPVACYATAMILVVQAFSGVVEDVIREASVVPEQETSLQAGVRQARILFYQGLQVALRPMDLDAPLDRVSRGIEVSSRELAQRLAVRFLPLIAFFGLSGILLFQRREIGGSA